MKEIRTITGGFSKFSDDGIYVKKIIDQYIEQAENNGRYKRFTFRIEE